METGCTIYTSAPTSDIFAFLMRPLPHCRSPNLCKYLYIINSILYSYHLNVCVCDEFTIIDIVSDVLFVINVGFWYDVYNCVLFKFSLEPRVPPPHGHPPGGCWVPWVPHALMHQRCEGCAFVNRMRQRVQWSSAEIGWLT